MMESELRSRVGGGGVWLLTHAAGTVLPPLVIICHALQPEFAAQAAQHVAADLEAGSSGLKCLSESALRSRRLRTGGYIRKHLLWIRLLAEPRHIEEVVVGRGRLVCACVERRGTGGGGWHPDS